MSDRISSWCCRLVARSFHGFDTYSKLNASPTHISQGENLRNTPQLPHPRSFSSQTTLRDRLTQGVVAEHTYNTPLWRSGAYMYADEHLHGSQSHAAATRWKRVHSASCWTLFILTGAQSAFEMCVVFEITQVIFRRSRLCLENGMYVNVVNHNIKEILCI